MIINCIFSRESLRYRSRGVQLAVERFQALDRILRVEYRSADYQVVRSRLDRFPRVSSLDAHSGTKYELVLPED